MSRWPFSASPLSDAQKAGAAAKTNSKKPADAKSKDDDFNYDVAMRRIVYVAMLGSLVVIVYSFGASTSPVMAATVGLMSAGAALLSGGLAGFLFGVPHVRARQGETGKKAQKTGKDGAASDEPEESIYTPSTSLEQIADWLTKIIVGVGLIDLRSIIARLDSLATRIQIAMVVPVGGNAFAFSLVLYFLICGFTFGFLWSRLYLVEWFRKVDDIKKLKGQITRLEQRQRDDASALSLILPQPTEDEDTDVSDQEVADIISRASRVIRNEIFERARQLSENHKDPDRNSKFRILIPMFKALIATDPEERRFEYRAELGYAFGRRKPPDLKETVHYFSEAIRIRDLNQHRGWRSFELRRALFRIRLDPNRDNPASETPDLILADLRAAKSDEAKWPGWFQQETDIKNWLEKNGHGEEFKTAEPPATPIP